MNDHVGTHVSELRRAVDAAGASRDAMVWGELDGRLVEIGGVFVEREWCTHTETWLVSLAYGHRGWPHVTAADFTAALRRRDARSPVQLGHDEHHRQIAVERITADERGLVIPAR